MADSNRIVMAPMTRARAGLEGVPTQLMATYYSQRASAGLIVTEATNISDEAVGWWQTPGIYTQAQIDGWKGVTKAVHLAKGRIFLQLWHTGRASHSSFRANRSLPVAPSPVAINLPYIHSPIGKAPYELPREIQQDEIPRVVNDYRIAAENAKDAGFDGVEIHAANGYLLDQFLQSKTNLRTDEYGGSFQNRFRLLREVVTAVLTSLPSSRVGVRISPNGNFNDTGSPDFRETFLHVARELDAYQLAYLHIVDGTKFGVHEFRPLMTLSEFRAVYHGTLIGNSGYSKEDGDATVRAGLADLIAYGRPFICNPDLVERFANGWPLAPDSDPATWYSYTAEGLADYPTYDPKV